MAINRQSQTRYVDCSLTISGNGSNVALRAKSNSPFVSPSAVCERGAAVTRVLENKTHDEIRVGDCASIERSLNRADLRLWAALTGNPEFDEDFVKARGITTWATSLFSTLIGSTLPGWGSTIQAATAHYHRAVAIGDTVTATVTVKEIRRDPGLVVFDCLCIDASGALIADAIIEVGAPKTKFRKERPEHRLEELVARCPGLMPMPTAAATWIRV